MFCGGKTPLMCACALLCHVMCHVQPSAANPVSNPVRPDIEPHAPLSRALPIAMAMVGLSLHRCWVGHRSVSSRVYSLTTAAWGRASLPSRSPLTCVVMFFLGGVG